MAGCRQINANDVANTFATINFIVVIVHFCVILIGGHPVTCSEGPYLWRVIVVMSCNKMSK